MAELFLPFRHTPVEPARQVRSTLLLEGIQALRARGFFRSYSDALTPELREQLLGLAAGCWVPVDLALAHYRAVDKLDIDQTTIETIGSDVATGCYRHTLSPAFSRAKRVGKTPWDSLAAAQRTNDLNWQGGDIRVYKEGPTQAVYEWAGQPCASVPYFVRSFIGYMHVTLELFCDRVYERLLRDKCSPTLIVVRFSWV